ncbi:MAG: hypothetical protein M0Z83_00930 [Betaproteobacteria bacterium]|nr:hypothetical protein [Betaproteobacteria bacterium]
MNILLAWELGGNWGHVSRDLPVLCRLQSGGHNVLYAVRDETISSSLSASVDIQCVAAPTGAAISRMPRNLAGYAGILFADGFGDAAILRERITGWRHLFTEHQIDVVVSDYAPSVLLAARVAKIPSVAFGSGFEIAPDVALLPSFCGGGAQDESARRFSEGLIVYNVNRVMKQLGGAPLQQMAQIYQGTHCVLATFAELDHVTERPSGALYAGPVQELPGSMAASWRTTNKPRVLVYLRGMGLLIDEVLRVLGGIGAEVIAVLPDAGSIRYVHADIRVFRQQVCFDGLLGSADLVIASGSGSITLSLLAGVPVLLCPGCTEHEMMASRVEAMGAGIAVRAGMVVADAMHHLLHDDSFRDAAVNFAAKYAGFSQKTAIATVIDVINKASSGHS